MIVSGCDGKGDRVKAEEGLGMGKDRPGNESEKSEKFQVALRKEEADEG